MRLNKVKWGEALFFSRPLTSGLRRMSWRRDCLLKPWGFRAFGGAGFRLFGFKAYRV